MELEMTEMTVSAAVDYTVQVRAYEPLKLHTSVTRTFKVTLSPEDNEETIREATRIEQANLYSECWDVTYAKMDELSNNRRTPPNQGEGTKAKKALVEEDPGDLDDWDN